MIAIDLVLLILLGTAVVFSIIELGLSAYVVSVSHDSMYEVYDPEYGYIYRTRTSTPSEVSYILFCSIWSILVSAALLAIPFLFGRRTNANGKILGFGSLLLNTVTMIFWLAGFAELANWYGGPYATGIMAALLAFAVLLWLVFLALMILNFLTAFGILRSDRPGQHHMFRKGQGFTHSAPMTSVNTSKP